MTCPHCRSSATSQRRHRTELGYRRFRCRSCGRRFNERTGTPFNDLQYPTDIVLLAVLWRLRYKLGFRDVAELLLQRGFARGRRLAAPPDRAYGRGAGAGGRWGVAPRTKRGKGHTVADETNEERDGEYLVRPVEARRYLRGNRFGGTVLFTADVREATLFTADEAARLAERAVAPGSPTLIAVEREAEVRVAEAGGD